ncbi:hypothetical protein, partial [Pseudomonas syringae group genomosp. 7]|uniref:hypothetical protein n=1 Tax=Pseudomonas syringae group genomosp. 7 TaxID=251699 RepID=UPI00376FE62B
PWLGPILLVAGVPLLGPGVSTRGCGSGLKPRGVFFALVAVFGFFMGESYLSASSFLLFVFSRLLLLLAFVGWVGKFVLIGKYRWRTG